MAQERTLISYLGSEGKRFTQIKSTVPFKDKSVQTPYDQDVVSDPDTSLYRMPTSGRTLIDGNFECAAIWSDINGIKFGSRDFKGISVVDFSLGHRLLVDNSSEIFPRNYEINELVSGTAEEMQTLARTSEYIRSHGLATEAIVKVDELSEGFYNGKLMPIEECRDLFLRDLDVEWHKNLEGQSDLFRSWNEKRFFLLRNHIEKTGFFKIERNLQVSARIRDLIEAGSDSEVRNFLEPVMRWVNTAYGTEYTTSDEDMLDYLTDFLPTQMGTWLGKFHSLGLLHNNPSDQNWSTAGTLYDLVTVTGEPVGSKSANSWEQRWEMSRVSEMITSVLFTKYANTRVVFVGETRPNNSLALFVENLIDKQSLDTRELSEKVSNKFSEAYTQHVPKVDKDVEFEKFCNNSDKEHAAQPMWAIRTSGSALSRPLEDSRVSIKNDHGSYDETDIKIKDFIEERYPGLWEEVKEEDSKSKDIRQFLADHIGPFHWYCVSQMHIIEKDNMYPIDYPKI